jgi:hypothetical protein
VLYHSSSKLEGTEGERHRCMLSRTDHWLHLWASEQLADVLVRERDREPMHART